VLTKNRQCNNVYDKESNFGSTMAMFKVMADCKNKFKSNQNVLKVFVLRSNISYLNWPAVFIFKLLLKHALNNNSLYFYYHNEYDFYFQNYLQIEILLKYFHNISTQGT
jgi:hypothetical protein